MCFDYDGMHGFCHDNLTRIVWEWKKLFRVMPSWTQGSVSSITLLTLTVQSVDTNTLITFYCYFTTCSTATQVGSWIQFTQQHCNNVYGSHSCIWSRARPIYWHFSLPVLSCMYVAYCTHFLYTAENVNCSWMADECELSSRNGPT